MARGGHLFDNTLLFCRLLRGLEMEITPTHMIDLVQAARTLGMERREDFKNAAQCILVSRHEQLELFDRVFDLFWQNRTPQTLTDPLEMLLKRSSIERELEIKGVMEDPSAEADSAPTPFEGARVRTYSWQELLRQKDFSQLSEAEKKEVKRLMKNVSWQLAERRTRRKAKSARGTHLDLRRVWRYNLRYGSEPLQLAWRRPKKKRRPLVAVCDISGSMEPYSRLLLQFLYVINSGLKHMEAFVFGTRLTRITHHLREQDVDHALRSVTDSIQDWGGGTRIGEAVKSFNYDWARRVLSQGAVVLLISDGWDRGNTDLLEREMARLQRSCQRLIWLNPLLGSPRYEPLTRGMQAALPHIDHFLPVHNLVSLEQLATLLEELDETASAPPQRPGALAH